MSKVYFAGDLHLDHKKICNFRKGFNSSEEHDAIIMDNILSTVTKRDKLFLMGDIAFSVEALELIKSLPCHTILICGNHDISKKMPMKMLVDAYDEIAALMNYKGYWLSHCPIHPMEMRNRHGNIHGHLHYDDVDSDKYVCVSLEHTNFFPITFDEVVQRFKDK